MQIREAIVTTIGSVSAFECPLPLLPADVSRAKPLNGRRLYRSQPGGAWKSIKWSEQRPGDVVMLAVWNNGQITEAAQWSVVAEPAKEIYESTHARGIEHMQPWTWQNLVEAEGI